MSDADEVLSDDVLAAIESKLRTSLKQYRHVALTPSVRAKILHEAAEVSRDVAPTIRWVLVEDTKKPGYVELMPLKDWHKLIANGEAGDLCATMMGQT